MGAVTPLEQQSLFLLVCAEWLPCGDDVELVDGCCG